MEVQKRAEIRLAGKRGGTNKKKNGRSLNGEIFNEIPLEKIDELDFSTLNYYDAPAKKVKKFDYDTLTSAPMKRENLYFIAIIPKRELREKINAHIWRYNKRKKE